MQPAGNYSNYDYTSLTQEEVDVIDSFSAFPKEKSLSRLLDQCKQPGHIASAKLVMSAQPTATDTIGIGSDTYEFLASGGTVADDAYIAVEIGGSAAITLTNLVSAINAENADNQHANALNSGGGAALANGTESVVADVSGTSLRIRNAVSPGGDAIVGSEDLTLTEAITAAADVWNQANLNATGRVEPLKITGGSVTITSQNLATDFNIELPFTPVDFTWRAFAASGTEKATSAVVGLSDNSLLVNANAGGSALIATDVIRWMAIG